MVRSPRLAAKVEGQSEVDLVAGKRSLERQEAPPVKRRQTKASDRLPVLEGRIALVPLPAVAGISDRQHGHHPIADHLCHHGGAGDRVGLCVPVDDRRIWPYLRLEPGDPVPIHEDVIMATQSRNRPTHGEMGRVVDVQAVDLTDGCSPQADRDRAPPDLWSKALALGRGQCLGVAYPGDSAAVRPKDDRGSHDGATGRRDPDFVDPGDATYARLPERALDAEGDPIGELTRYIRDKVRMSRDNPKASRLFANEILHGAPTISPFLKGPLKQLVDEKAAVIKTWMEAGRLTAIDPHHLIFAIWATTQHYADFDVQVSAIVGAGGEVMTAAEEALIALFVEGLRPRSAPT